MSREAKKLLEKVLSLSEPDRASIAGALIESLHGPEEQGVEGAWEAEIERRIRQLERGEVQTVPWSEVRERLFDGYV